MKAQAVKRLRITGRMILMNKEDLIREIKEQLAGLNIMTDAYDELTLEQAIMLYDLQFRLKSKLYELSKEGENV